MSLAELEKEVKNLSPEEFSAFARWLEEYASSQWEARFEKDVASGKLHRLGRTADLAFEDGRCSEL